MLEWNTFDGILQQGRDPAQQVLAARLQHPQPGSQAARQPGSQAARQAGSLLYASARRHRHGNAVCGPQPQVPEDLRGHRWFGAAATAVRHGLPHLLRS